MQLFLPRMTCLLYSSLDSRLLQQFVKEGTSEKDQLQGDSALQDTYKKKKAQVFQREWLYQVEPSQYTEHFNW